MELDKFDDWWTDNDLCSSDMINRYACRVLWDAATKAEREACAKVCESLIPYGCDKNAVEYAAEEIRKRSNG
jgi:hypothetical protein